MKNQQLLFSFSFFILLSSLTISTKAQVAQGALGYFNDALLFSRTSFGGTARFQAIGGANTALGGDISNINANPAGLAFFRRSEMTLSPGFLLGQTSTDFYDAGFLDNTVDDGKNNFNVANFGVVFSQAKEDHEPGAWRGGALGLSITRVNNFQNQFSYNGFNFSSSKSDFYVEQANGISTGDLENLDLLQYEYQRAAYFAFLVNPFEDGSNEYFTFARNENEEIFAPIFQEELVESRGAQYQIAFSAAGNYDDKFYFGGTLGLSVLNYRQDRRYAEDFIDATDSNGAFSFIDRFSETNRLNVTGTGINATVGMIFRPIDAFRIGASISTPTFFAMNEEFNTTFSSSIFSATDPELVDNFEEATLPGSFNYSLRTPWRATVGGAFFFKKYGFISLDAEYVLYDKMNLRNREFSGVFDADNETIEQLYQPTLNIRAGGELRYNAFRFRGGFALEGDPFSDFSSGSTFDRSITRITGGLGIRQKEWYADLGVIHSQFNSTYQPYSFEAGSIYEGLAPFTEIRNRFTNVILSLGFFF